MKSGSAAPIRRPGKTTGGAGTGEEGEAPAVTSKKLMAITGAALVGAGLVLATLRRARKEARRK